MSEVRAKRGGEGGVLSSALSEAEWHLFHPWPHGTAPLWRLEVQVVGGVHPQVFARFFFFCLAESISLTFIGKTTSIS